MERAGWNRGETSPLEELNKPNFSGREGYRIDYPGAVQAWSREGIPRDLAREQAAKISKVFYHVTFTLIPRAGTAAAKQRSELSCIRVQLPQTHRKGNGPEA